MGFWPLTLGGFGLISVGAWESLSTSSSSSTKKKKSNPSIFLAIFLLSFCFILNSVYSLLNSVDSRDRVGSALQLQVLPVASLFLTYSILGLLKNFTSLLPLSCSLLNLIACFGFVEEFMLFYLQRKDTSGIENRYFDLLLVPIFICVFSTLLELRLPDSVYPNLVRGVGLILQGTWFVQMGISFHTNLIAHGCTLYEKSRGNYTIRCKDHPEYHRGRAIATLLFNCHLAFLIVLVVVVFSIVSKKNGVVRDSTQYKPLGAEMQQLDVPERFTLESDNEDNFEIGEGDSVEKQKAVALEMGVYANGSPH